MLRSRLIVGEYKRIGKEFIFRKPALSDKILTRGSNHQRRTASIDLMPGKVRKILHHSDMNKTLPPGPQVALRSIRQYRNKPNMRIIT